MSVPRTTPPNTLPEATKQSTRLLPDSALAWVAGPILLALLLSARTLGWGFLWDDYDFLGRAATLELTDFLPVSDVIFYRPISRELYFWLIHTLLGGSPFFAHVLNLAVASSIIVLLMTFVARLAGPRAALVGGLFFSCSASLPLMIGWISASQDLLCLLFAMIAFHLQLSRRTIGSAVAMGAALLSKETALALMPVPVAITAFQGSSRHQVIRVGLSHLATLTLWILVHPWPRGVFTGAMSPTQSGGEYVAFRGTSTLSSMLHGLCLAMNLPLYGETRWTGQVLLPAIVASGILALLFTRAHRRLGASPQSRTNASTLLAVSVLMVLGPVVMTSMALEDWSPHYALIPTAGISVLVGILLNGLELPAALGTAVLFLWLGVVQRDTTTKPTVPSELNFREADRALKLVEWGFRQLRPTLPAKSNVYVSVQARGHSGLYRQLYRFQPLRVWYGHADLWVLDPNRHRSGADHEFLFWITPDLGVVEIDTKTLRPHGSVRTIDLEQYKKVLRGYSYGLAAGGDLFRAVQILITMPQNSPEIAIFDRRSAAMLLLAAGRSAKAAQVLEHVPSFDYPHSVDAAAALLIDPVPGLDLDEAALRAFDLDPNDPLTVRHVMLALERSGTPAAARRFAQRLQILLPGDRQSAAILQKVTPSRPREITAPIPYDIP